MTAKIEVPKQPFLYVAIRPFLEKTPMTKKRCETIAACEGRALELALEERTYEPPDDTEKFMEHVRRGGWHYESLGARPVDLVSVERIPVVARDELGAGHDFDGYYRFYLRTDQKFLPYHLHQRKDPGIACEQAFGRYVTHWGTQRWSGIQLSLQKEGKPLFTSAVDIFAPETRGDLSRVLVVGAYSEKPRQR